MLTVADVAGLGNLCLSKGAGANSDVIAQKVIRLYDTIVTMR